MSATTLAIPNTPHNEDFDLSADHRLILDQADRYAKAELYPLAERMDNEEWWPAEAFRKLGDVGFLGVNVPEQYGGGGLDLMAQAVIAQAFARWNHAFALSWGAHDNLCIDNIYRNANEDQRRRYLPDLCSGKKVGALCLTEPGAGSDALGSMATTARRDGDHYILNGSKIYITNGPIANTLLVYAKTDKSLGPHGISAFIVEKEFPGFKVAQKLIKMGHRGSPTAEIVFEDCRVPAENRLMEENNGVAVVMSGLDLERALVSALGLGMAERALELCIDYVKTRKQFDKPIASFQMVQSMIAEIYVCIESMRSFIYRTVARCSGLEVGGGGRGEIHKLTAGCIMHAGHAVNKVLDLAVQLHGGYGYMWETEINRLYRANKLLEIGAGTTEVRKLIIAKELLSD